MYCMFNRVWDTHETVYKDFCAHFHYMIEGKIINLVPTKVQTPNV